MSTADKLKNNPEDSVDAAEEKPAPPDDAAVVAPKAEEASGEVEPVPKENGTSECNADSNDGEDGDDDGPAEPVPDEVKEKPKLKRVSDAIDVASEGSDDIASPDKKAKLEESTTDTSSGDAN